MRSRCRERCNKTDIKIFREKKPFNFKVNKSKVKAFDKTTLTFKFCLDLSHSIPQEKCVCFLYRFINNNFTFINMYLNRLIFWTFELSQITIIHRWTCSNAWKLTDRENALCNSLVIKLNKMTFHIHRKIHAFARVPFLAVFLLSS